jgi:signal transduction histidine kinase
MGMGLSISRSIIQRHSGQLWATPNPKHGTTFHFSVPVMATSGAVVEAAVSRERTRRANSETRTQ